MIRYFALLITIFIFASCGSVKGTEVVIFDQIVVRKATKTETLKDGVSKTVVDITPSEKKSGFLNYSAMKEKLITPHCKVGNPNIKKREIYVKYEEYNMDDYERKTKTFNCF